MKDNSGIEEENRTTDQDNVKLAPNEKVLAALREVAKRQEGRRHTDQTEQIIREGRAGGLYGRFHDVVEGIDPNHFYFTATSEEFNRALDEIAEMNRDLPVLPPEAFNRESIYEDY